MKKLLFENKPCGRCGGSGQYSYCSMYGSRCFGCGGSGAKLTKRGAAAQEFLNEKCMRRMDEFKVGDLIWSDGIPGFTASKWGTVTEVIQDGEKWIVKSTACEFHGSADQKYRRGLTAEEKTTFRAEALAYQATLGKNGKPLATKAAVAVVDNQV